MYTENNKGFTVITNFGCDCNCQYWEILRKRLPEIEKTTQLRVINWLS